eukprot:GHVN01042168.1.p1 GENE.GHVN01042168.1~~GHVN01042168.1.p1  ORF type:complete len:120 (-),score=38.64 GHVN01042168.1:59-418(-)
MHPSAIGEAMTEVKKSIDIVTHVVYGYDGTQANGEDTSEDDENTGTLTPVISYHLIDDTLLFEMRGMKSLARLSQALKVANVELTSRSLWKKITAFASTNVSEGRDMSAVGGEWDPGVD